VQQRTGAIGLLSLSLMGLSVTVGAGVFVLTGAVAARHAGPAVSLSYIVAGLAAGCCALALARLMQRVPSAHGLVGAVTSSIGPFAGWLVGAMLIVQYLSAASYVAAGWSGYARGALDAMGAAVPAALAKAPIRITSGWIEQTGTLVDLPAIAVVLTLAMLATRGLLASARVNMLLVALKFIVLIGFILYGLPQIEPGRWSPFIPEAFGMAGVMSGAAVLLVAYLGFDALTAVSLEVRRPERTVPIAIMMTMAATTLLYVGVATVLTGLVDWRQLDVANPLTLALTRGDARAPVLEAIVAAAAITGLASVILVLLVALPRVAAATFRLLSSAESDEARPPSAVATLAAGGLVAVLAGFVPLDFLSAVVAVAAYFILGMAALALLRHCAFRPLADGLLATLAISVVGGMAALLAGQAVASFFALLAVAATLWVVGHRPPADQERAA
jgi:basic amino acid/polyamine antiporter, APA family